VLVTHTGMENASLGAPMKIERFSATRISGKIDANCDASFVGRLCDEQARPSPDCN
jgi:hypothetical protein